MRLFKGRKRRHLGLAATIALSVLVIVGTVLLLGSTGRVTQDEQRKSLERAIHNALISCYAIEGRYPDTLEKVTRDYGVVIDTDKYYVSYEPWAENLMPDITVILKGEN